MEMGKGNKHIDAYVRIIESHESISEMDEALNRYHNKHGRRILNNAKDEGENKGVDQGFL